MKGCLVRGLVFSFLLLLPHVHEWLTSSGYSIHSLQDTFDESLYLRVALDAGAMRPQEAIYFEHSQPLSLQQLLTHWRPDQTYSHFLVGSIAQILSLRILLFNFALDIIFVSLTYVLLARAFAKLMGDITRYAGEVIAAAVLGFPWLTSLENFLPLHPIPIGGASALWSASDSNLPILEGVEAQLSWCLSAVVLNVWMWSRTRGYSWRTLTGLGAACGIVLYGYVLAWMSLSTILALVVTLELFFTAPGKAVLYRVRSAVVGGAIFTAFDILIAFPGLLQIAHIRRTKGIFVDDPEVFSKVFYAPWEWIILGIALGLLLAAFHYRIAASVKTLLILAISSIAADLLLLNFQPLTGTATTAVFLTMHGIRPLFTAATVGLVLQALATLPTPAVTYPALLYVFIGLASIHNYKRFPRSRTDPELTALTAYIDTHVPKGSVLAMLPYVHSLTPAAREWDFRGEPNAIAAITQNYLLKESIGLEWGGLPPDENMRRELATGFLFSGTPQVLRPCLTDIQIKPPKLFFQQWIAIQLHRRLACETTRELRATYTPCDALSDFRIDYVVWEQTFGEAPRKDLAIFMEPLWRSESGRFQLFRFDQQTARATYCH